MLDSFDAATKTQILREVVQATLLFSADEVDNAFLMVESLEYPQYEGRLGPKTQRLKKVRKAFVGRENEEVSIQEIEESFLDTDNPSKAASNAVAFLNTLFLKYGLHMKIEGTRGNLGTTYKFMRVLQ